MNSFNTLSSKGLSSSNLVSLPPLELKAENFQSTQHNLKNQFSSFSFPSFQVCRSSHKNVTMSGGLDVLSLKDTDVTKLLAATSHLGSENVNFQMEQYVFKRRPDGVHIINLGRTWEKLLLAARVIASVEHAQEVSWKGDWGNFCGFS
jgi:hypothetical protein